MKHRCVAALFSMVLMRLPISFAQQKPRALPKDLPPYGPLVPFRAPNVEIKTLPTGLTLWLVPRPGFPKVAFAFAVRGGGASDPKDLPGLSDLIVAAIDQGTKTRTAKQIAEEIQAAGGDLSGNAGSDAIVLSTEVLASQAELALAVLADIMQNATFPDAEVDLAKRNAADNLRASEADPSFLARRALAKAIFGDHPYGVVSATQDSIAKTSPDDLRKEYAVRFRPDQAALVAVGDFDAATLTAVIEKHFGRWAAPTGPPVSRIPAPSHNNPRAIFYVARPGSVQTTIYLGALGPRQRDPDYPAAEVANAIYGGMFGSRLVLNIREDKGYTYSPGSFLTTRREAGVLQTRADVRNAVTGAALNEIDYELNRMATTTPTSGELTQAQRYLVGVKAIVLQVQGSVAGKLADLWVDGLPSDELGRESEKIEQVAAKDVEAVAESYFPASHQTTVAVGEEKVIQEQLSRFGVPLKPAP